MGLLLTAVFGLTVGPESRVQFTEAPTCIDQAAVTEELGGAMHSAVLHREIDLLVVVTESVEDSEVNIGMRAVTGAGEVVLDRSYGIVPADCENAPALLRAVLARFLESFPIEKWTLTPEPRPQEPRPDPAPPASGYYSRGTLSIAGNLDMNPLGASTDVLLTWDFGVAHRFIAGVAGRLTAPADVGTGQFWSILSAVVLGWGYRAGNWMPRASVVVGGLYLFGTGFDRNLASWVPWLEFDLAAPYRLTENILVGPRVGFSPIVRRVTMGQTNEQREVSNIRVGLGLWIDLGQKIP